VPDEVPGPPTAALVNEAPEFPLPRAEGREPVGFSQAVPVGAANAELAPLLRSTTSPGFGNTRSVKPSVPHSFPIFALNMSGRASYFALSPPPVPVKVMGAHIMYISRF
jgi:hypothetical protein